MSHIDFMTIFTQYVRMMGYATIVLCTIYAMKMKKYHAIMAVGDMILGLTGLSSVFIILIGANLNFAAGTIFTLGVFLWMVAHLINVLRV